MPRFFRVWEKKRGDRRTGSHTVGIVGEAIFFGALFLLGAISLAALFTTQAIDPDPHFYNFGYGVYLTILVLASFILIGGGGVFYTIYRAGASDERRSAIARQAARLELIREGRGKRDEYPTIPDDENLTNSPGTRLTYRLPSAQSELWQLIVAAVASLVWMGTGSILLVVAINGFRQGEGEWLLVIFVIPFLAIGLGLIYYFFRQLLLHTGIGPTSVEISSHPLVPGSQYAVCVAQSGRLTVHNYELWLVCEEEVTYHQGTDIRTECFPVFQHRVFRQQNFKIEPGKPFEHECLLEVPAGAMHSFLSDHAVVRWKLMVKGESHGWPEFIRTFPIIVFPPASSGSL